MRLIEKGKLEALEKDKNMELQRLAAEREAIELKEKALLDDINRLKSNIKDEEQKFRSDADKIQK